MEIKENKYSILQANLFYLVTGILLLFLGSWVQSKELISGLLITEYLIVLLSTLLFMKIKDYDMKHSLKLNKITFKQGITVIFIVLFAYPVGVFLNYIMLMIISSFTKMVSPPVPIPDTPKEFWISFFVIALSPGICEEIMFRGFILSSYEKLGKRKAIIYSAILFGIFHFNLQNLVGPIFLGLIFGIMVYKTDSIYSAVIGHTFNNALSIFIGYSLNKQIKSIENIETSQVPVGFQKGSYLALSIIIFGLIAFVSGVIAFSLLKSLPERKENIDYCEMNNYKLNNDKSIVSYIPIFIVIGIYVFFNYKFFFS